MKLWFSESGTSRRRLGLCANPRRGAHTGVHHQKSVESDVSMENASIKCWLLSRLCGKSSTNNPGKVVKHIGPPYLLRDQEDTRFYLFVLTFRTSSKVHTLRRGFRECQTEVEGRM